MSEEYIVYVMRCPTSVHYFLRFVKNIIARKKKKNIVTTVCLPLRPLVLLPERSQNFQGDEVVLWDNEVKELEYISSTGGETDQFF